MDNLGVSSTALPVGAMVVALTQAGVLVSILYWFAVRPLTRRQGTRAIASLPGVDAGRRLESGAMLTATAAWTSAQIVFETAPTPPIDFVIALAIIAGLALRLLEAVAQWAFAAAGSIVKLSLFFRTDCFDQIPILSLGVASATVVVCAVLLAPVLILRGKSLFLGGRNLWRHRAMRAFALVELATFILVPGGTALWSNWTDLRHGAVVMIVVLLGIVAWGAVQVPALAFPVLGVGVFVAELTLVLVAACHTATLGLMVLWFVVFGLVATVKR